MRSDRHKLRLPIVRIGLFPARFIALTASTASPLISRVLAHGNGGCSVEENTTLVAWVSSSLTICSSGSYVSAAVAKPDIWRYVFAPIKIV